MKKLPRKSLLNRQIKIKEPFKNIYLNNIIMDKDHSQDNLEPEGFLKKVKPETANRKKKRKPEPEVIVTQLVFEDNFTEKGCETVQPKKRRKQILTPRTDDHLSNAYGCPTCNATFASIFDLKNHITKGQ